MIYGSLPGSVPLGGFFSITSLTAQSMFLTPAAIPCYDPCTLTVTVTWINNTSGTLPSGQVVGISVDGIPNTTTTTSPIAVGDTVTKSFTIPGLLHSASNLICPIPN